MASDRWSISTRVVLRMMLVDYLLEKYRMVSSRILSATCGSGSPIPPADTTMNIADLAALWGQSGGGIEEVRRFIFGSTPMLSCLREIVARFDREADGALVPNEERVLLIISDGEPTEGDPSEFARELHQRGILVACAFVTDRDVQTPLKFVNKSESSWPGGARLLFGIVSSLDNTTEGVTRSRTEWRRLLQQSGWEIPDAAHMFVQANDSDVLADFMRIAAIAMSAKRLLQSMPFIS